MVHAQGSQYNTHTNTHENIRFWGLINYGGIQIIQLIFNGLYANKYI